MKVQAQRAKPSSEWNLEWLLPLALLGAVFLLAVTFVGHQPFHLDNDRSAQAVEFGLALAAFATIGWGFFLTLRKRAKEHQLARDRLLVAIGLSAFFAYFNFGHLHFGNFVHIWDTYHYYMGAKYFPELGYEKLYECATVADAENGHRSEEERHTITDLRTNTIVRTTDILEHPERCKDGFTQERWEAFRKDIGTFRGMVNEQRWIEIHKDHGYNATPVWTIAGMGLANTAPASLQHLSTLNLLDPIYLALTLLMVWWAFGPRAFAIAALILGTNFPNRYYWTGGAFLRHDWVFYFVASVCLLKKEKFGWAGAAIAYSTLLRLFPGLMLLGPALAAVEYFRLHRKLDPKFVRFVAGGAAATVVLLSLSTAFVGGLSTWQRFAQNTVKHSKTPLTNHMGLRTLLSYRPSTTGQQLVENNSLDPWAKWKDTRLEKWNEAFPLYLVLMGGALALVYLALRNTGPELWVAAALGVGFIVFGAELTNYYYCFLMGMAVLHEKKREVGLILAGLTATTLFIEWHPLTGMSGWLDEQYVAMSAATLVACVAIWWSFTRWGQAQTLEPEGPSPLLLQPAAAPSGKRAQK